MYKTLKILCVLGIIFFLGLHFYLRQRNSDPVYRYFHDPEYHARVEAAKAAIYKEIEENEAKKHQYDNVSCGDVLDYVTTDNAERKMLEAQYKSCLEREQWQN